MNRRDFLRALGWCAAAVVAGEPIAKAWAAAIARARRRRMIDEQITYQASKAMEAMLRKYMQIEHLRPAQGQIVGLTDGVSDDDYIVFANEKPSEPSAWQGGYEYLHRTVYYETT